MHTLCCGVDEDYLYFCNRPLSFSALTRLGGRKGTWPVKNGGMVEVGTG